MRRQTGNRLVESSAGFGAHGRLLIVGMDMIAEFFGLLELGYYKIGLLTSSAGSESEFSSQNSVVRIQQSEVEHLRFLTFFPLARFYAAFRIANEAESKKNFVVSFCRKLCRINVA